MNTPADLPDKTAPADTRDGGETAPALAPAKLRKVPARTGGKRGLSPPRDACNTGGFSGEGQQQRLDADRKH